MATQKRYREYKSPIESKDSMEPLAIVSGIGPQFGFNIASVDANLTKLTISAQTDINKLTKYRYISDKSLAKEPFNHGVITPDGILTIFTGNIELGFNKASFGTYKELLVIATHRYLENDGVDNTTTLAIYPNGTANSMVTKLSQEVGEGNGVTMGSFIAAANLVHTMDEVNEVIVGIYSITDNGVVTYIPVGYEWPEMVKIPKKEYLDNQALISGMNTRLETMETLTNTIKQMSNSFNSKTVKLTLTANEFYDGYQGQYNWNFNSLTVGSRRWVTFTRMGNMLNIKFSFRAIVNSDIVQDKVSVKMKLPYSSISSLFDSESVPAADKILPLVSLSDFATRIRWVPTELEPNEPTRNNGLLYARMLTTMYEYVGVATINVHLIDPVAFFIIDCKLNRKSDRAFSKGDALEFIGEINLPLTDYYL